MPIAEEKLLKLIQSGSVSIAPYDKKCVVDNGYKLHVGTEITEVTASDDNAPIDTNSKEYNSGISYPIYDTGFVICPNRVYSLTLLEGVTCKNFSGQIVPDEDLAKAGLMLTTSSNIKYNVPEKLTVTISATNYLTIYPGAEIATMYFTSNISDGVPSGGIIMWSGYDGQGIPDGWVLCNGENGTPDLRDRFIVGSGNRYSIGNTGGEDRVTLNIDQIPEHKHNSGDMRVESGYMTYATGAASAYAIGQSSAYERTATVIGSTGTAGGSQSHENRPPYYALAFIMKL